MSDAGYHDDFSSKNTYERPRCHDRAYAPRKYRRKGDTVFCRETTQLLLSEYHRALYDTIRTVSPYPKRKSPGCSRGAGIISIIFLAFPHKIGHNTDR